MTEMKKIKKYAISEIDVIPKTKKLRQEDHHEFEVRHGYIARFC